MITIILIFVKITLKALRWEENIVEVSVLFSAGQCKRLSPVLQFWSFS